MEKLLTLAQNTKLGYLTNNKELFVNSAMHLYNHANSNKRTLIQIDDLDLQTVGLAFSYNARFIRYDDPDFNSVSAENAYYCLAKSIKSGNYFSAPELYNLLKHNHTLLIDRFVAALILYIQKTTPEKMPSGMIIQAYGGYKTKGMIEDAESFVPYVRLYIISQFYSIESNKSKFSDDLILFCKYSDDDILSDISEMSKKGAYENIIKTGKVFFELIYTDMENILLKD